MPIVIMILKWCMDNWKIVLIGLFVAWVGFLVLDNKHLKNEVADLELKIVTIKNQNKALESASAAISRKYDHTLADKWKSEEALKKSETERIRNEKILRDIRLPNTAVSVFNNGNTGGQQAASGTQQGNDGGASGAGGTQEGAGSEGSQDSGLTLADLLVAARENRLRLQMCIDVVHTWQAFWLDFVGAVNATEPKKK